MDHRSTIAAAVAMLMSLAAACDSGPQRAQTPAAVSVASSVESSVASTVHPEVDGWATTTPRGAGFRTRRLDVLATEAKRMHSTCFAVFRRGRLVRHWNWRGQTSQTPREVFSITKSVIAALVGIAVMDGDLSLDDRAAKYIPQWRGTPSADVTIRNLLRNDSGRYWSATNDYGNMFRARNRTRFAVGLHQQFAPGEVWAYNNAAIQTLDAVLRAATGMPTDEFARLRLFEPLGMTNTRLTRDSSGKSTNVYFGMQSTCTDLAKFGLMYLRLGTTHGTRLLSRAFIRHSVGRSSTPFNAAYGYLWWLNRYGPIRGATDALDPDGRPTPTYQGQLAPGAPAAEFAALGLGGQTMLVDPASRIIVVRLGQLAGARDYTIRDASRVITWARARGPASP